MGSSQECWNDRKCDRALIKSGQGSKKTEKRIDFLVDHLNHFWKLFNQSFHPIKIELESVDVSDEVSE